MLTLFLVSRYTISMIRRLFAILLVLVLVGIIVYIFIDSSGKEVTRRKGFFSNPFDVLYEGSMSEITASDTEPTPFPFPATPRIPIEDEGGNISYDTSIEDIPYDVSGEMRVADELLDIERNYDSLAQQVAEAQQFGNPSPYRGQVHITDTYSGVTADDVSLEYLMLEADPGNTAPVVVSGWSLQSVYNNIRVTIPQGTRMFYSGAIPETSLISVSAGEKIVVSSGVSPVGISFKENLCTGYLGQFQIFIPTLEERCPTAESEVLVNPATSRTADPECVAFAQSIPRCQFYIGGPPDVSDQCYSFIRNSMTYNGCVAMNKWRPSFAGDTWRVFLSRQKELWKQEHDVVRLLDQEGRVVDIWAY